MLKSLDAALLQELRVREYAPRDKYLCQKVLTSNYGDFFSRDILRYLADYLAQEKCYYLVIEHGKQVIACGGIELHGGQNHNTLVFGLVHRAYHRNRIGTLLLMLRLALIDDEHESALVTLETNAVAAGFYERFGFRSTGVRRDEYGFERHALDYALALTREDRQHIRAAVGEIQIEGMSSLNIESNGSEADRRESSPPGSRPQGE